MTKETYEKSVNKLLDAYNNGTLFHGHCSQCAVGNLLETNIWNREFYTERMKGTQVKRKVIPEMSNLYTDKGLTKEECMQIEHAFERAIRDTKEGYEYYCNVEKKTGQYIGLKAVLTLMETMVEEEVESGIERLQTIAHDKYMVTI